MKLVVPNENSNYVNAGPGTPDKKSGTGVDVEATHVAKTPYTGANNPGKGKAEPDYIEAGPGDEHKRPGTGKPDKPVKK